MTLKEVQQCDFISMVVEKYRDKSSFIYSPCWMDEWALGYFCALRDVGVINVAQWEFLCGAYQQMPEEEMTG